MKHIESISEKLKEISKYKDNIFGISSHNLLLNSALPEKEVISIEQRYGVTLPQEYRDFLIHLGNGGAGPGYGMLSLEAGISYQRAAVLDDILSRPFDHTGQYNPEHDPRFIELEAEIESGQLTEQDFDRIYEYTNAGTLVVSHEGCGYLHRIIITGPSRNKIWADAVCSDQGYVDMGVSFIEWYENWLDHILDGHSGCWWLGERKS